MTLPLLRSLVKLGDCHPIFPMSLPSASFKVNFFAQKFNNTNPSDHVLCFFFETLVNMHAKMRSGRGGAAGATGGFETCDEATD